MRSFLTLSLFLVACAAANAHNGLVNFKSASVNDWADKLMMNLRPQLIHLNLDPAHSPDFYLNFTYNFLFQEHEGKLNLTNGYIIGVSTLERLGDCVINYDLKILRIDLNLLVKELRMAFEYGLHVLGMEPSGNLEALVTEQAIVVSIAIDVDEVTATLQHLELPNDGKMKIDIDGLGILGNALADVVLLVVDKLFKDTVIGTITDVIKNTLDNFLAGFHPLPPIPPSTTAAPTTVADFLKF